MVWKLNTLLSIKPYFSMSLRNSQGLEAHISLLELGSSKILWSIGSYEQETCELVHTSQVGYDRGTK